MSIQTLTPLSVFPSRQNYISSSAYGFAVETWLNEEHVWNGELISLRGQLNTSIDQFNADFLTIDDYVTSATQSAESAEQDATFCAGVSATLAQGSINDSATTLTTTWSSHKLSNLFSTYDTTLGQKLDSTSYTAEDVLAKLKTVDGIGSELDADLLDGYHTSTADTVSTVAVRDGDGDITSRLFRSTHVEQTTAPATTADIAFRNDTGDNYIRFMNADAIKAWLTSIGATGMRIKNIATLTLTTSSVDASLPFTISDIAKVFVTFNGIVSNSITVCGFMGGV